MAATQILVATGGGLKPGSDDSIQHGIAQLREEIGPAPRGDSMMDPSSQINATTGILDTTNDYMPPYLFRKIRIKGGAGGQTNVVIKALYASGGTDLIPIASVAANDCTDIPGLFAGIFSTAHGTTATNLVPLF